MLWRLYENDSRLVIRQLLSRGLQAVLDSAFTKYCLLNFAFRVSTSHVPVWKEDVEVIILLLYAFWNDKPKWHLIQKKHPRTRSILQVFPQCRHVSSCRCIHQSLTRTED